LHATVLFVITVCKLFGVIVFHNKVSTLAYSEIQL